MSNIGPWLEQHGLGKYTDLLIENEVDFDVLDQITLDELKDLGIPLGARKRILKAVAAGIESGPSDEPPQSASTTARAGISKVRAGAGIAIVGNPRQVAETLDEFVDVGCTSFCLSGYPHAQAARTFTEKVMPLFKGRVSRNSPQAA